MTIRTAQQKDLPEIQSLLQQVSLPIEGVSEHVHHFLVAQVDNKIIGTIGLELYPPAGLIRSAAVLPEFQKSRIRTKLSNTLISIAKEKQLTELYLFTNTAESYFARKGFTKINREDVNGEITSSAEFRMNCCASAVCMKLRL
ncbi:MAG: GNAT family N-acetyltransferase [Ignavibacteriae bacterium]|nr:GNAT family N-acetyltransferase [Ignavibacteriota bacterium]